MVNDVTNIEAAACLKVHAIRPANVSACDVLDGYSVEDDDDIGIPSAFVRSAIAQCRNLIKMNTSSAPIPMRQYKMLHLESFLSFYTLHT